MGDRDNLTVEGFLFSSVNDAELASSERKKIEIIKQNINYKNLGKVRQVYDKMLDEKQFRTPVGWSYLQHLRSLLIKSGEREEDIRPVPTYFSFTAADVVMKNPVKQRVKLSRDKQEALKSRLTVSVLINIMLLICVIAMFYIAVKSDTPNMLNYRQSIVNQYSSWEQELSERENEVREKERELNIK